MLRFSRFISSLVEPEQFHSSDDISADCNALHRQSDLFSVVSGRVPALVSMAGNVRSATQAVRSSIKHHRLQLSEIG